MRGMQSGRGTRLLRQECRRRDARNWRDNVHLPQMSGGGAASAAESTGGEGAQKGGRLGGASRNCAKARARAVTRSSSCTIADVCTITNVQLLHPSGRGHTDSPLAATAGRQEQGRVQGDQEQGDQEQGDQEQDQEQDQERH